MVFWCFFAFLGFFLFFIWDISSSLCGQDTAGHAFSSCSQFPSPDSPIPKRSKRTVRWQHLSHFRSWKGCLQLPSELVPPRQHPLLSQPCCCHLPAEKTVFPFDPDQNKAQAPEWFSQHPVQSVPFLPRRGKNQQRTRVDNEKQRKDPGGEMGMVEASKPRGLSPRREEWEPSWGDLEDFSASLQRMGDAGLDKSSPKGVQNGLLAEILIPPLEGLGWGYGKGWKQQRALKHLRINPRGAAQKGPPPPGSMAVKGYISSVPSQCHPSSVPSKHHPRAQWELQVHPSPE